MKKRSTQSRWSRLIPLAGALVLMVSDASAQMLMPNVSPWQPDQKRLTPAEERERQKRLDDEYKAAAKKIPDQKANDPWAIVRPTPTIPDPKTKQQ
jgi:hypothetical protein